MNKRTRKRKDIKPIKPRKALADIENRHSLYAKGWPLASNVSLISTYRDGGVSTGVYDSLNLSLDVGDDADAVRKNRALVAAAHPKARQWQWLEQVHGAEVRSIKTAAEPLQADGLHTSETGLALCVLTADCVPVLLAAVDADSEEDMRDSGRHWATEIAIVHAGWRGLTGGVVEACLQRFSADRERVMAFLGPAIGPCHYEVGSDVYNAFRDTLRVPDDYLERYLAPAASEGKYTADLQGLTISYLVKAGIMRLNADNRCTYCHDEFFYSFRRDGRCGRMLSAIYMR